jgi:hypothetical protein
MPSIASIPCARTQGKDRLSHNHPHADQLQGAHHPQPSARPILLPRNNLAGQGPFPPACLAEGQWPFGRPCAEMPDPLPLGLRGAPMIVPDFRESARLMRRSHVGAIISPRGPAPGCARRSGTAKRVTCGFPA